MNILNMLVIKNYLSLNNLTNWILCFLPISFILGSMLINLNIILLVLIGFLLIRAEKLKINFNKTDAILLSLAKEIDGAVTKIKKIILIIN